MKKLKSVLFDHDGTLVNSEGIHYRIWCDTLLAYGLLLTESEYKAYFVGIPSKKSSVELVRRHGLKVLPEELLEYKEARTLNYLQQSAFPLMPGAKDAVAVLSARGLRLGIVTGAGPDGVEATLRDYAWRDHIETTVCATDVANSKPAPDVYKLALARLGLSADEAIAVEDTTTGVAAARAAGLRCLAIPHEYSIHQDFTAATTILRSMSEALTWIQDHGIDIQSGYQ